MGLLKNEIFVCVDCESTGLDPQEDAIIEVGAVRFTIDQELDRIEMLVDPKREIPEESQAIHHISCDMVAGKPTIDQVLPEILTFLGRSTIVGHGVGFDLALLANAAQRAKILCTLQTRPYIDTLRLARLYGQSPNNALETLREHFGIRAETAHRALDDAVINMEVFKHLSSSFKTTEQLFNALSKPVKLKRMPLGKHKGRPFNEVPLDYLKWASHQSFDQDLLFSIRSELKQRQSGNNFRQSSNPFQGL